MAGSFCQLWAGAAILLLEDGQHVLSRPCTNLRCMLQDDDTQSAGPNMQFIDFEYARWGPRGFDLGNHFNEYAGFECDYSRYPDKDHIAHFMRHYLSEGEAQEPVSTLASAY